MVKLKKLLMASTLMEAIVAMVIIMICSGIGLTMFSNLSKDVNDDLRTEAEIRLNSIAIDTKNKRDFTDSTYETENLRIERIFQEYKLSKDIRVMIISSYNLSGRKVCDYKEIIANN
jgi:hypothetical protein